MKISNRCFISEAMMLRAVVVLALIILPPGWVKAGQLVEVSGCRQPAEILCLADGAGKSGASHALLVDKQAQRLLVYAGGQDRIRLVGAYPCSTGKARGAKQRSGDRKTPEGVYFFVKKYLKKDLAPIYGSMAFPLDYPNRLDRLAGRSGYAIWLHGTNKALKPRDSNGCIVVENSTIGNLASVIRLNRTPIIITARAEYRPVGWNDADLQEIRALVEKWCRHLARGSYLQYSGLFADNRAPSMRWWSQWCSLRRIPGDGHMRVCVTASGLEVYRQGDVFCVTFDQVLDYRGRSLPAGRRKFFLRKQAGIMRIVTESYLGRPAGKDRLFSAIKEIGNG